MRGGTLAHHLSRRRKTLSHSDLQFLLGSVVLACEVLHGAGIVYRDLKVARG